MDTRQHRELVDAIKQIATRTGATGGGGGGGGDMYTTTYDTNTNGIVDAAESVPWTGITGTPSTFPPAAHAHIIADTTGLQAALDAKAPTTHNHDTVYAPITHSHVIADVTNLQTTLDGKAAATHTHPQSDITNLVTDLAGKAPLASPALTGTPTVPTAAVDTNTTQAASTAFVVGQAGSSTPANHGTAAVGTSLRYARQDHVHNRQVAIVTSEISADQVTNTVLANMGVNTIKGRITAGTGDPEDLTATQVRSIINVADGANNYVHPNHSGDITSVGDGSTTIVTNAVTNTKLADVPTATFKGRTTAGTGDPEDLTVTQAKTLLNLTGTNSGDQTITLTGDVTGSGTGSFAATIGNNVVSNAKLADVATGTIKGRVTASTGDPEDLTGTQVTTLLNTFTSTLKGLVGPSGGGTTNFLRADGTWVAPPSGGGGTAVVPATGHTVTLSGFPRMAYYDTVSGTIKESRSDNANSMVEMVVVDGTSTTLTVKGAVQFTGHGYALGQALFLGATGGLTTQPQTLPYIQRVAVAPHADYLVLYDDPPRAADFSKLSSLMSWSPFKNKRVTILGDSITEFATTWSYLKEYIGATSIENSGVSSSSIAWHPNNTSGTLPFQSTTRVNGLDVNANLVIVFGCTNDWYWSIPLGSISDLNVDSNSAGNTFYGGVNKLIDLLRAKYPGGRIVFLSSTQRNYNYSEGLTNGQGLTLKQYCDAMELACRARSIPYVNNFENFQMQRDFNLPYYTYDGIHFDLRGYTRFQYYVASALCYGASGIVSATPPIPDYFYTVFDQPNVPNSDVVHVHTNNGLVYMGNLDRDPVFFVPGITTIEWTQDVNTSPWVGVGGSRTFYTGVSIKNKLITDFTPPTFGTPVALTALVSDPTLAAMTRFRMVSDAGGVTVYGYDGATFVQLFAKLVRANFPTLSGWASNFKFSTSGTAQYASNGNPDGQWWGMKNASVNGVPLYQALQYGGI